MDIHRCRFVPYPSSAINALAFSHSSNPVNKGGGPSTLRLAIGRANGDIEIWNPLRGVWYQEIILRGGKNRSIEGLIWTQDPEDVDKRGYKVPGKLRLFSIGYSQAVTEWDLAAGRPLRHSAGNYGEIWCMTPQPRDAPPKKSESRNDEEHIALEKQAQTQNIAAGCADGSIILLSTADDDLQFTKVLARPSKKRTRVLNLTFQNRHIIVAGHADSTIRIYDMRGGQQVRNMTLGGGPKGGPKETLVWSVKCLNDGTIVSGDSTGTVSFWDSKHYALVQRVQGHEADVLDLAVSADGQSVFSGGMDRRTVLYRKTGKNSSERSTRWGKVVHNRLHQNDVKTMATFEAKGMSVLVSGGLDTNPIVTPVQEFGKEHHRTLSSLPQQPALSSASETRLVLGWWDRELSIWSISEPDDRLQKRERSRLSVGTDGRKLVAKVALQGDESITSADLASDGTVLAVATITELKLFHLRPKDGIMKVQKMQPPPEMVKMGAKIIQFSPDKRWLLTVTSEDTVELHRFVNQEGPKKRPRLLNKAICLARLPREPVRSKYYDGSLGSYDRSIIHVAFSSDSRILVAGDLSGYIDSWLLEGHEDLTQDDDGLDISIKSASSDDEDEDEEAHPKIVLGQHWIRNPAAALVPKLRSTPLVLSFRPSLSPTPRAITSGNIAIHPTRHNPYSHSHNLPDGEDRLLVLTAGNDIIEFKILSGKMSDWSRRNPASILPQEFRDLRDQARGLIWDLEGDNERVWVYGVNWLWMFDLAQNLPIRDEHRKGAKEGKTVAGATQNQHQLLKRKRQVTEDDSSDSRRGRDTGAGSAILDSELNVGISRKVRKINGADTSGGRMIDMNPEPELDSEDGDDSASANQNTLVSLRRGSALNDVEMQDIEGQDGDVVDGQTSNDDGYVLGTRRRERPPYWHTYKYRPILGIVPLNTGAAYEAGMDGAQSEEKGSVPRGIEVALVERPLWDMDLPARYHGNQEWDP
ncbi:MAG: hypothetical protein Q9164_001525 [Protoblastenia rupestris]